MWQPGKVELDKISHGFTYLVANDSAAPPPQRTIPKQTLKPILRQPGSKCSRKWTRRRVRWDLRKLDTTAVAHAIAENEAFLDSAATSNFNNSASHLELTGPSQTQVAVADGHVLQATHTARLPMTALNDAARTTTIVPHLAKSLMSVGVLANNGYTTIFHPHTKGAEVYAKGTCTINASQPPVLQGWRDNKGLWSVAIQKETTNAERSAARRVRSSMATHPNERANNVFDLPSTQEVIRFLHASLGFPTKQTLLAAIRNKHLTTFPGLTVEAVNKHFPDSDETQKGHMRQARQGVRSTKIPDEDALLNFKPTPGVKHKDVYLRVYDATKKAMYTDQTGRFPVVSSRGNKYLMIACELDGNYIDAEPLRNRSAAQLTQAYQNIFTRWKATNVIAPNWHIMDNEAPEDLKKAIRTNGCRVELTPADMHRRNAAERAIQTLKGHFISVLAGVADDFPISEWDQLIPQTVLTLNLLRPANIAPNVSAFAYHHGQFDYNRMPLAPMGCAVQFHIKPNRRRSWGEHASDGWYLRASPEHYRTHVIFVKATRKTRVSDTVYFKHKYLTQPTLTQADAIVQAYRDLIHAIQGSSKTNSQVHIEALQKMHQVLEPQHNIVVETPHAPPPRVQQPTTNMQHPPRVHKHMTPQPAVTTPTIVIPRPQTHPQPLAQVTPHKHTEQSIAERVRARRRGGDVNNTHKAESIAERVKRRRMEVAAPVLDHETGELLEYRALLRHPKFKDAWSLSAANEFDRLAQGKTGRVKGTNTITFINKKDVPQERFKDVTYIKFVCQVRTEKKEPNRTRATLGGNLINYPDDVGTPTADLLLIKIFLNSVISTKGAKFANADISNFYLMTPLKRPEFAKVRLSDIPQEIITLYKLEQIATADGWVYIRVDRGMYGLPQSGSLGHDLLEQRLNAEGYFQSRLAPGLWKHKTRNIQFVLVVDDFGIKYIKQQDMDHLITSLRKYYDVSVDMEGREFVKIELDWDYEQGKVHLSMKPYLLKALRQFDNLVPRKKQDSPYPHVPPKYGLKQQFAEYDSSPDVGKDKQKEIQTITGKFLWYARAVDNTMLAPLSELAAQQSKPTENTVTNTKQFLDYCATQQPAKKRHDTGRTQRCGLLECKERTQPSGGHHFLSENQPFPPNNGAIHNVAEIIKAVMSSAAEAEMGALYINARKAVEERQILEEMGHPQPPTPIQTDNSTAEGIINSRVQPKRTKAMDMRFHWLRDRAVNQQQFRFYWRPGTLNLADYFTKHHPPAHHRNVRSDFISPYAVVDKLRQRLNTSTARVC
eukprot:CCRYP_015487-RA/>CCRYP_015487-RA protein AED:0.13 eAED:0.11 QI:0/0/0/1/0/0.5/2/0/1281